jgi:hypothetical protein
MIGSARYWREIPQRYRYEAAKCTGCGKTFFPPRLVCSACGHREFETTILAQEGSIEAFTVIHVAPSGFTDEAPYAVAIVKLDDGVQLMAQVADAELDQLKIGDRMRIEFRKVTQDGEDGILCYGYKFVPTA